MASKVSSDVLKVMKLSSKAILPTKGSTLAAGFDLASAECTTIPARGKGLVKTDLAIAVPFGCYARIAPRSGLAYKKHIDTGAGVIDADYRGNVGVVLFNHSEVDFEVKEGDRIAQLILEKILYTDVEEVESLSETERGAGGFGSTGVSKRVREPESENVLPVFELKKDLIATSIATIQDLSDKDLLDEPKRKKLKKMLMNADAKQFDVITGVLCNYSSCKNDFDVAEWIDLLVEDDQ